MKKTVAALLLMSVPALAGAGVLQDSATAGPSTHTTKLILHEQNSHQVGKHDFVGTDRVRSAATRNVVGFDSFTGHFYPKMGRSTVQAAFSFKGGLIVVRVQFTQESPKLAGRILSGTGVYRGIEGTLSGRDAGHGEIFMTMHYTL